MPKLILANLILLNFFNWLLFKRKILIVLFFLFFSFLLLFYNLIIWLFFLMINFLAVFLCIVLNVQAIYCSLNITYNLNLVPCESISILLLLLMRNINVKVIWLIFIKFIKQISFREVYLILRCFSLFVILFNYCKSFFVFPLW